MNAALWIVQGVLAFVFLMTGVTKLLQPEDQLEQKMAFVRDFKQSTIKLIGVLELLGALGLVLPTSMDILAWLTPAAAAGLVLTMLGAIKTHVRRNEYPMAAVNVLLLVLAAFVVYGRFDMIPL